MEDKKTVELDHWPCKSRLVRDEAVVSVNRDLCEMKRLCLRSPGRASFPRSVSSLDREGALLFERRPWLWGKNMEALPPNGSCRLVGKIVCTRWRLVKEARSAR